MENFHSYITPEQAKDMDDTLEGGRWNLLQPQKRQHRQNLAEVEYPRRVVLDNATE